MNKGEKFLFWIEVLFLLGVAGFTIYNIYHDLHQYVLLIVLASYLFWIKGIRRILSNQNQKRKINYHLVTLLCFLLSTGILTELSILIIK